MATTGKILLSTLNPQEVIRGKNVFLRVDFNVPLQQQLDTTFTVQNDMRIKAALPTIRFLAHNQGKIVICSHLGRPRGVRDLKLSLSPVAKRLQELMPEVEVKFLHDTVGPVVQKNIQNLQNGQIIVLENVRYYNEEYLNNEDFAKLLAENMDIYVNDAFGSIHREHASIVGITPHIPVCAGGFLLEKELKFLGEALESRSSRPLAAVVGGAKMSTKLDIILNLLRKVDKLLIGGAMVYTFYRALGCTVGDSMVEEELIPVADEIMKAAERSSVSLILASDSIIVPTNVLQQQLQEHGLRPPARTWFRPIQSAAIGTTTDTTNIKNNLPNPHTPHVTKPTTTTTTTAAAAALDPIYPYSSPATKIPLHRMISPRIPEAGQVFEPKRQYGPGAAGAVSNTHAQGVINPLGSQPQHLQQPQQQLQQQQQQQQTSTGTSTNSIPTAATTVNAHGISAAASSTAGTGTGTGTTGSTIREAHPAGSHSSTPPAPAPADPYLRRVVRNDAIPSGWTGVDLGPVSMANFRKELQDCRTVLWNGPMGITELAEYAGGTWSVMQSLAQLSAQHGACTIVCGGETVAVVEATSMGEGTTPTSTTTTGTTTTTTSGREMTAPHTATSAFTHVSTGGSAALQYLEGAYLPGLAALDDIGSSTHCVMGNEEDIED